MSKLTTIPDLLLYYLAEKSFGYFLITMKWNYSHSPIFGYEPHVRALRPDDDESKILKEPQELLGINRRKLLHLERLPAL